MKLLEPIIFLEDTEILEPFDCLDLIAHKNLKVFETKVRGLLSVIRSWITIAS